jgi:hypothetical protein
MMDSSKRNGRTRVYGDEGPAQLTHSKSLCRGDLHTRSQSWRVVSSMVCRRCRRCRRGSRWAQGERKERSEGTGAVGPGPCYDFYYACRIGLVHGAMSSVGFSARFLGCPGAGAWKLHGRRPAGRPAKPSKLRHTRHKGAKAREQGCGAQPVASIDSQWRKRWRDRGLTQWLQKRATPAKPVLV